MCVSHAFIYCQNPYILYQTPVILHQCLNDPLQMACFLCQVSCLVSYPLALSWQSVLGVGYGSPLKRIVKIYWEWWIQIGEVAQACTKKSGCGISIAPSPILIPSTSLAPGSARNLGAELRRARGSMTS